MNEGDRAQVQAGGVCLFSAGAMGLQTLLHHAQENEQCRIECALVALQVVAQAFGDRQHPLAHWQMGEDVVDQMAAGEKKFAPPQKNRDRGEVHI